MDIPEIALKKIGFDWAKEIGDEFNKDYLRNLASIISKERTQTAIYPPQKLTFRAFTETPFSKVKVCILGQDPYAGPDEADGLAFSCPWVNGDMPSFKKIFNQFQIEFPSHFCTNLLEGNLQGWASEGVLLLNSALTVRHRQYGSHTERWEPFIARVIQALQKRDYVLFVLVGGVAKKFYKYISSPHEVIIVEHPAYAARQNRKWKAEGIFHKINKYLEFKDIEPINWEK
jgi:uracil-DNA glycosylase